jgi:BirA family biotin operon repressor/biotin-[acetyl-CoA-carboxylase] ligase
MSIVGGQPISSTPVAEFNAASLLAQTFLRHVEVHDELGSTNDRAKELARELPSDKLPALVLARRQTTGRGRGQNVWWSADGALTFSVILDTNSWGLSQREWPQISLLMAAAARDAITSLIPQLTITIKSPNDVLIEGRKVCGILLESPGGSAPAKDRLIVGIGLNVNNSCSDAPPDVQSRAVAIREVSGERLDLQTVLIGVLQEMDSQLRK